MPKLAGGDVDKSMGELLTERQLEELALAIL
jgi:hypothetical protein